MEPLITGRDAISREEQCLHNSRVSLLKGLGLSGPVAEIYADQLDWHEIARLVQRGRPPRRAPRNVP